MSASFPSTPQLLLHQFSMYYTANELCNDLALFLSFFVLPLRLQASVSSTPKHAAMNH